MLWLLLLPTAAPPHAVYVDVILPQEITFREKLTWTGKMGGPSDPIPLVAPVAGRVVENLGVVRPSNESPYRKGDVLLRIDDRVARFAAERARASRDRARAQRELAEVDLQLARMEKRPALVITRAEKQLALARADETLADINVREAEARVERHLLRAPVDGWLEEWSVKPHDVLKPNQALGVFHPASTPEVEFTVSKEAYEKIIRPLRERRSPLNRAELTVDVNTSRNSLGPATLYGYKQEAHRWRVFARLHQPFPAPAGSYVDVSFRDTWEQSGVAVSLEKSGTREEVFPMVFSLEDKGFGRDITWHYGITQRFLPGILTHPLKPGQYLRLVDRDSSFSRSSERHLIPLIVPIGPIDRSILNQ